MPVVSHVYAPTKPHALEAAHVLEQFYQPHASAGPADQPIM
jgi:hypothetical protein